MSTDEPTNIVHLAAVNNTVEVRGNAAKDLVVKFLREYADSIENGETEADKAVLVLHYKESEECFMVRSRCCNTSLVERVGMLQLALNDMCCSSLFDEDDENNRA